jgi:hypothetical protein
MSTLLERLVGDSSSLGSPDWKKPQYLLDAIAKRKKRSRTSKRAFCPTGEGGGVKNDCGSGKSNDYDPGHFDIGPDPNGLTEKDLMYSPTVKWTQDHKSLVRDAVQSWKGSPTDMTLHVMSELKGGGTPGSGSGKIMRAQATALLTEVLDNGEPAPTLYRGASIPPEQDPSPLLGWTSKKSVAVAFAKKNNGEVYTLEGATGLDTSKIKAHGMGEAEWIVAHKVPDGYRGAKAEVASVPKPKWMGDVDASGTTNHGTWFLEKNTKQQPTPWRGDDEATTHVVSLVDGGGKVKAFAHADLSDERTSLYMNYSEVAGPHRGQGVYKSLLDSLSEKFRVVSDEEHNVAPAAKKAYESLGARLDSYGHYVLDKKKKHEDRAFCPNGEGGGVTNTCGKGIGINDAEQDFTGQILSGEKTIETRVPNSLKPYIGKTVGIVRTGKGKATLVGVMKIGEPKFYKTRKEFDADYDKHRVGKDSPHYIGPEGKYGYPLSEVKPVKPRTLDTKGHVARVIAKSVKTRELTIEFDLGGESPEEPNTEARGDAPSPKKDQIKGSDVNDEGSAKNKSGDISLNESIIASLKSKAEEHNAAMRKAKKPAWTNVSLPALKAVYRRGAGAFSTSHRPGMTRDQWAMARVNAFLTLARRGRPENAKYTTDNDLLHSSHPKHSKEARAFCATGEGNGIDNSCGAKVMSAPDKDGGGSPSGKPLPSYANDIEHSMPKSKGFDDPKNALAWLNPNGTFFPVSGDHGWYAERHGVEGGGDTLLDAGWLRVAGHSGGTMYVGNPSGFAPRGRQLSALKDFAISTGRIKRIIFDNGKSRTGTVLWQSDEDRSADCGRDDDGRFSSGNKCGGSVDMPKEDPRGRMRYDNGVQTDAARKLYQMGSSEKKLKGLVDAMGGDPKHTRVDINPPSLNISVADSDGNKLFHIDFENGRARLYPAKDLTTGETANIKKAAGEAFGGRQSDNTIKVFSKAEDMKKWESENAAKIKKWEDKYKFSTLLPPHQRPKKWERSIDAKHASLLAFAQSRGFCPNGEGNGVTNTCSSKDGGSELARIPKSAGPSLDPYDAPISEEAGTDVHSKLVLSNTPRLLEIPGAIHNNFIHGNSRANVGFMHETLESVGYPTATCSQIAKAASPMASDGDYDRARAAILMGQFVASAHDHPAIAASPVKLATDAVAKKEIGKEVGSRVLDIPAYFMPQDGIIRLNSAGAIQLADRAASIAAGDSDKHTAGWFSTKSLSHCLVHEEGHRIHFDALRSDLGLYTGTDRPLSKRDMFALGRTLEVAEAKAIVLAHSNPDVFKAIEKLSGYACTSPREAVAEYYAKAILTGKRDKHLDKFMDAIGFPVERLGPQKKAKK